MFKYEIEDKKRFRRYINIDVKLDELLSTFSTGTENEKKQDSKELVVPQGYSLEVKKPEAEQEGYWNSLFTHKRGEKCNGIKIITYEMSKLGVNVENGRLKLINNSQTQIGKDEFGWVKNWGYGPSAYFFDYLDPVLRDLHLEDFDKIWKKFSSYSSIDSEEYKDPFNKKKEIPPEADETTRSKIEEYNINLAKYQETQVYKDSINAVQLNRGLHENKWFLDRSLEDNAKAFIRQFDINRDGRLSPRELLLGSIYHNKGILGSADCTLCYEELTDKIDGIFAYMDCDNDGLVGSQDLFEHLPKLRRDTTKWNFFSLAHRATIRTAVTNDFILKNMFTVNGMLNKNEFRLGVLLGFWDRQTDNYGIIKDDKLNLKKLRWQDDDVVDTGALIYIKNIAEQIAEEKKRQMLENQSKQPEIRVQMRPGHDVPPGLRRR